MVPTLKIGSKLGRFTLDRNLGMGGMGIVFLAHDTLLDVKVALKVMSQPLANVEGLDRFRREVLLARRVSHPDICRIFDIHEEEGLLFITMEHVEGSTLESLLEDKKLLSVKRSGEIVNAICNALSAAHKMGVVHRDLKPSNIIIRGGNQISLLDFGLAKALDMARITVTGALIGTIHYMSPEVMKGKNASPKSDIYSLGVILYRCVTGRLPFHGEDVIDLKNSIEAGDYAKPSRFNPNITPAMDQVITKAMSANPKKRYKSVDEMHTSLYKVLESVWYSAEEKHKEKDTTGPWHGDVEKSVSQIIVDPGYSDTKRTRFKDTTMLFSDIVGITPYFDKHGDMAGRRKIATHDKLLIPLVDKHKGKVIKTIGDAIMACFDRAEDGVEAAMEMQQVLEEYNSKIPEKHEQIFIRIGLHSGISIFESNDVFGNTVNVAARVSSKAKGEEILISSQTREMMERNRHLTKFHSVTKLKGKQDVFNLYSIQWVKASERPTLDDRYPDLGSRGDKEPITDVDPLQEEATARTDVQRPISSLWDNVPMQMDVDDTGASEVTVRQPTGHKGRFLLGGSRRFRTLLIIISAGVFAAVFAGIGVSMLKSNGEPAAADASLALADIGAEASETTGTQTMVVKEIDTTPASKIDTADKTNRSGGRKNNEAEGSSSSSLVELRKMEREILSAMYRNGIGAGDSKNLDSEYKEMMELSEKSKNPEAIAAGKRILAIIKDIQAEKALKTSPSKKGKKDHPTESRASLLVKLSDLESSIERTMREKGIIQGDVPDYDTNYRRMKNLWKNSKHSEAIVSGKQALAVLKKTKVGKTFVAVKIARFNRLFDDISDGETAGKLWILSESIMKSFDARKYEKANKLTNKAFRIIGSVKSVKNMEYGYLVANTRPWSKVYIDGEDTGRETPIAPDKKLRLPVGTYQVSFETTQGNIYVFDVTIKPGKVTKLIERLE